MEDIDKILSKSYAELTPSEKAEIQDICGSEEEFIHLQQVFASVENYARETQDAPSIATKKKLDDLFYQTYQNKGILWYNSIWMALYPSEKRFDQRPLVRIAAVLVLLVSIVPFLNRPAQADKKMLAKVEEEQSKPEEKATNTVTTRAKGAENELPAVQKEMSVSSEPSYDQDVMMAPPNEISAAVTSDQMVSMPISAKNYFNKETAYSKINLADGIYMDTLRNVPETYPVSRNMAMLDVLTPTF